jgi:hypothetical protein
MCLVLCVYLRFTGPLADGHFGARHVVAEIIFTIAKIFLNISKDKIVHL